MATRRWLGAAADTSDVWTITIGGTWATNDTLTVTINNKTLVITVGTTTTVAEVCTLLAAAWAGTAPTVSGESFTPTAGGKSIPEFNEYTAAATSTTVVFTARTAGVPGTIAVSETSTSGTASISNTTVATGRKFFNNAANWSGATAPVNGDTVVFDAGSTDCLYNLSTGLTGLTIQVLDGYTGRIGLPDRNGSGTSEYDEYRTKYLTTAGGTATVLIDNSALQRCRIAVGANTINAVIRNTGQRENSRIPVVLFTGGNSSSTLVMTKGDAGAAFYIGETAQFNTIDTSFATSQPTDVRFWGGSGLTTGTVTKNGGDLTFNAAVTALVQRPNSGTTTVNGAGAVATANIGGGTLYYNSTGALGATAVSVSGDGLISFDRDPHDKTVSNPIAVYGPSAKLSDENNVVGSLEFQLYKGAKLANVSLGPDLEFAVTAAP